MQATPALLELCGQTEPPVAEPLEVVEPGPEAENVASLNAYRRQREEPLDGA